MKPTDRRESENGDIRQRMPWHVPKVAELYIPMTSETTEVGSDSTNDYKFNS